MGDLKIMSTTQVDAKDLPLSNIRVLDLSRVFAGPQCGMILGDFGAEVIKIEHPVTGDDSRSLGIGIGITESSYFNAFNRNKRSVTVDLQTFKGQEIIRELAKKSDVIIENFKLGGLDKLGLGYKDIKAIKDDIIYCSISGYDRKNKEADRLGYDLVIQGETGLMAVNGEPTQPPLKFGITIVDIVTGMYSSQAILAALYERQRTQKGRQIEMALFDCGLMITSYCGLEALINKEDPPRYSNAHSPVVPYGVFEASDGALVITVGNNSQFSRFCSDVLDRQDLADDLRFKTNQDRKIHREILMPQIQQEVKKRKRQDLLNKLIEAGIPCGEVLGLSEALESNRVKNGGLITEHRHPVAGLTQIFSPPYRFDGERMPVRLAPPVLGKDTHDVLSEILGTTYKQFI